MSSTRQAARLLGVCPQFRVRDLQATADHYRDVLGFEVEPMFGDPPVFTQVRRGAVTIQLGRSEQPSVSNRAGGGVGYDAYIHVDDAALLAGELQTRGARILEGPVERVYQMRELVVEDRDGMVLCFAENTACA